MLYLRVATEAKKSGIDERKKITQLTDAIFFVIVNNRIGDSLPAHFGL